MIGKLKMTHIFLNDDDVISIDPGQNFAKTSTSKIKEVKYSLITEWLKGLGNWVGEEGVRCQVLLANRIGWHKGKVRLRIEFIPDNPSDFIDKSDVDKPLVADPSPLDDLRSDLKI